MEIIAANSSLCDLQMMLSEEDTSLEDFDLLILDLCKEQHIQNCPEQTKVYFEENHIKLNEDQHKTFERVKSLIEERTKTGN